MKEIEKAIEEIKQTSRNIQEWTEKSKERRTTLEYQMKFLPRLFVGSGKGWFCISFSGYGLNFINRKLHPPLFSSRHSKVYKNLICGWQVKVVKP